MPRKKWKTVYQAQLNCYLNRMFIFEIKQTRKNEGMNNGKIS
ncbi:hypothetical protein PROVRUST_07062 [Providencia rustigianii DSM 4541]|uniref:Uncharacterized protein n=1 Tax=Providencia rustigianii DSM 4541 TaxID=500637 RepID=D1P4B1_9GAMM|nr:hypothetical protein PROVRUST_07062 [Providencia rustigianii DSM 4541]